MDCLILNEGTTLLHNIGNYLCLSIRRNVPGDFNFDMITSLLVKYKRTPRNVLLKAYYYGLLPTRGHAVAHLVEALRYKPEGREFDSHWCHWNFSLT